MAHAALEFLRIIDVAITDDFLERRTKAVNLATTRWRKLTTSTAALEKANLLADALVEASGGRPIPDALRTEVGNDIKRHSPTHDAGDHAHDLEVAVVAAVAAIAVFDSGAARTDACVVFAESLSAAMDIDEAVVPPQVADLWQALSQAALTCSAQTAAKRRNRVPVPTDDPTRAVAALADNARKDAEEINILWWTLNDWSTLAETRVSALPAAQAVVVAAIELSTLLSYPAIRAHRQIAHRNLADLTIALGIGQLALDASPLRTRIDATLAPAVALIEQHARVFVALNAVVSTNGASATVLLGRLGLDALSFDAWRWCERLVRELSLIQSVGGTLGSLE